MKAILITVMMILSCTAMAEMVEESNNGRCPQKCVKINLDERYAPEWCCKVLMCNTYIYNKTTKKCELSETKAEEYPVPCLKKDDDEY
jgi:hypothetical protein